MYDGRQLRPAIIEGADFLYVAVSLSCDRRNDPNATLHKGTVCVRTADANSYDACRK